MAKASALTSAAALLLGNCCMTKANAVIGATASAFTTGNAVTTVIGGIMRTLAAQTNTALTALAAADFVTAPVGGYVQPSGLLGFYTQPANTTVYYVLAANAAGTVRTIQGTYAGQPINGQGLTIVGDGAVPDVPDGWVAFAVAKVASGGATFIPGTTALTGLATFFDVAILPFADRP